MESKVYVVLETYPGDSAVDIKGVFSNKEEAIAVYKEVISADNHLFDDVILSEIPLNKKNYTFNHRGETVTSKIL